MKNQNSTIMVVEDDSDIREEICQLLQDEGLEVLSAENGREGLEMLRARPDVRAIVLDLVMPVMNGATFRGEQLADPAIASIPLILLTGRDDFRPLTSALSADICVRKPFAADELLRAVGRYV